MSQLSISNLYSPLLFFSLASFPKKSRNELWSRKRSSLLGVLRII